MLSILERRFQHISPISVTCLLVDAWKIKLFNYKDIIDYINQYQIVFDNILSLVKADF